MHPGMRQTKILFFFVLALLAGAVLFRSSQSHAERSRDLGLVIGKFPTGAQNAITDVAGVRVGQVTLNSGAGPLVPGKGPVRTGVTVIMPADGDVWTDKVHAGSFVLNGNGEVTGLMWLEESGILETPIAMTNTLSIGTVQNALVSWMLKTHPDIGINDDTLTPVVMECDDSTLNDIRGRHVKEADVFKAIDIANSGPVAEGAVGAGTGMISYDFKGGIGTASRVVEIDGAKYTVGILLNTNHGWRETLRILGAPIGEEITDLQVKEKEQASITLVLATDAPLSERNLSRLAKRTMLGIARTGGISFHSSGDVAIAFSTANRIPHYPKKALLNPTYLSDFWLHDLFEATTDAAEEAQLNALLAAITTTGRDGNTAYAMPKDRLREILKKYGRR